MGTLLSAEKRINRETLADSVYQTVLEAILSGRLPAGTILSVVQVAKDLDVSRTPVNEALRQLARDGIIEQAINRRARVKQFTRDDVSEVFEMRKILEGAATLEATATISDQTIASLRAAADQLAENGNDIGWTARWADHDEALHTSIANKCGLRRLADDIGRYRLLHRVLNLSVDTVEDLQDAVEQHLDILSALADRNADAAKDKMIEHISTWQAYFVDHFPGE
jgi:DNA-binding GntR family transcriptional regulator